MKPTYFKGSNAVLAKDQDEYQNLPVRRYSDHNGTVVSCWKLTWFERVKVLFTGRVWFQTWTFNDPLQPQLPTIHKPEGMDNGA